MLKHAALTSIQRIPFVSAAAGTLLCIILTITDNWLADLFRLIFETGVITSGFMIIYFFSVYLGFCIFQRIGLYYTFMVFLCVWIRRYPSGYSGLFGDYLHEAHIIMSALGLIYLAVFAYRRLHPCHGCNSK